jgi:hypothetical protein
LALVIEPEEINSQDRRRFSTGLALETPASQPLAVDFFSVKLLPLNYCPNEGKQMLPLKLPVTKWALAE